VVSASRISASLLITSRTFATTLAAWKLIRMSDARGNSVRRRLRKAAWSNESIVVAIAKLVATTLR